MKLTVNTFRGEAPRTSPRNLPDNGAQEASNCRLQTGDLESWRQFLLTKTLASAAPVQTVYKLNGAWLSWSAQVDVARGVIAGDTTFRTYLTGPGLYPQPRFTNYAMATGGAEPYPVVTRPLGVPGPTVRPTGVQGIDPNPLTFTVAPITDPCDDLGTNWTVSPGQIDDYNFTSKVVQNAGFGNPAPCFELGAENNGGSPAYATRDFGVANTTVATMQADVRIGDVGGNDSGVATLLFGVSQTGEGCRISLGGKLGDPMRVSIRNGADFAAGEAGVLMSATGSASTLQNHWYTVKATRTVKEDKTVTVVATVWDGATQIATVTSTNTFEVEGYCGFITAKGDDRLTLFFDNFVVSGSGSTNYVAVNIATSYVYTYVNDLGEQSPPSPPSDTILHPDGVTVTITLPAALPAGTTPDYSLYGIVGMRLYRAVSGASGTIFLLLADETALPIGTTTFVDSKDDSAIANSDVLDSDEWDLPPDDLQGILALPNGIMAGFRRNQLCLSAAGRPHAWPVAYRLTVDTDIVAIANIDNTVVIGTRSFLYTATGNSPDSYAMSKPGEPQACVAKRSMVFVADVGVAYASPDGFMVCSGSAGQVKNATEAIFTKRQWAALNPASIIATVHDGVLFFFSTGQTPASGYALDTTAGGFGLIRLTCHATALHVDPLADALHLVLDANNEPTAAGLPLASTAVVPNGLRLYEFDAGTSDMVFRWRGRLNLTPYPLTLLYAQVRALAFTNLLVRFYGNGALVYEKTLADTREFTLPAVNAFDSYEIELLGTSTTRSVQAADDVSEIT